MYETSEEAVPIRKTARSNEVAEASPVQSLPFNVQHYL